MEQKLYHNCFIKANCFENPIESVGYVREGKCEINMSATWTKLIHEVGRFCERYASDLLINYESVRSKMDEHESFVQYFGIRESGVDSSSYVLNKNPETIDYEYRKIYRLIVNFEEDEHCRLTIKTSLEEVEYNRILHNIEKADRMSD